MVFFPEWRAAVYGHIKPNMIPDGRSGWRRSDLPDGGSSPLTAATQFHHPNLIHWLFMSQFHYHRTPPRHHRTSRLGGSNQTATCEPAAHLHSAGGRRVGGSGSRPGLCQSAGGGAAASRRRCERRQEDAPRSGAAAASPRSEDEPNGVRLPSDRVSAGQRRQGRSCSRRPVPRGLRLHAEKTFVGLL